MADKAISQLNAATSVTSVDLFVLEQSGEAKKLTGQILENWLVSFADGHGGIQDIVKTGSSGTNPVVDTYTITLSDETTKTFQVVNGVKGDTGDQTYVWIRYAAHYPTSDSDMGTSPDAWIGIYSGLSSTAPTHYTDYSWYEYKGETGETGAPATITAATVGYQQSDSGSVVPEGSWTTTVPDPAAGKFLWTRIQIQFNTGSPITAYSVARYGIDGSGAVVSVNSIPPDSNGNIQLLATNIQTLDSQSIQAHLDDIGDDVDALKGAVLYPTGDQTDRAAEIASKLSTYGHCELAAGEFYIGSTISMPSTSTLKGSGKTTIIKRTPSSTSLVMFSVTGSNQNVTFRDLYFVGSNVSKPSSENTGSGEQAIVLSDNAGRVTVDNCGFYGLTKTGVHYTSGYSWLTSLNITNCSFLYCNYGIGAGVYGEFANITNCNFNSNFYGALVIGGNNKFVNCGFDANTTGLVLWDNASSPSNDGHGSAVGCTFDHNTSYALSISNIDNGFLFSSCCFFYGDIYVTNSRGIQFDNCLIMGNKSTTDHTNFNLSNNPGLIAITNCCGTNAFTITKTGTNSYVFVKNNKTRDGAIIAAGDRYDQSGYATGGTVSPGGYGDITVTFPVAFPSAPYAFFSPQLESTNLETGKIQFFIQSVSTTQLKVRMFNNASIDRAFNIYWRAYLPE